MNSQLAKTEVLVDALRSMAQVLRRRSDPVDILDGLLKIIIELSGAQRGLAASSQAGAWQVDCAAGFSEADLAEASTRFGLLADGLKSERGVLMQTGLQSAYPALCLPLVTGGRTVGVLYLDRTGPAFAPDDLEILELAATQLAGAAEKHKLDLALKQVEQSKTKFISVVSHELRLPMTSIKGYTDLMRQGAVGPVNEMQTNFLDVIRNSVDRMSALISDLSDLSKLEAGRLRLDCKLMPLSRPVSELLMTMKPSLAEKDQRLVLDVADDLASVYADSSRVKQILINLLTNSHRYTPSGGQIHISAQQEGNFMRVSVQDSGVGIGAEDQKKIFSPFLRSDDAAVREHQGWGLSLHVSKLLVELMGGEMGFESELGRGSTLWFTLPLSEPPVKPGSGAG